MRDRRNYIFLSFGITFLVIAMLLLVMWIPPFKIAGIYFKRVNILSDIVKFDDPLEADDTGINTLDRDFVKEGESVLPHVPQDIADSSGQEAIVLDLDIDCGAAPASDPAGEMSGLYIEELSAEGITQFEDYTQEGFASLSDFCALLGLKTKERVVRIAFFGDSFIEGDIITADVREQLQQRYGGEGVGFVPFGNPLTISRSTVRHNFNGWTNYNLINKRTTPEPYKSEYYASGIVSVPSANAWSSFEGVNFRQGLGQWSASRIIFSSRGDASFSVKINDTIVRDVHPSASDRVQQVLLTGAGTRKMRLSVSHPEGFTGYGVVLEGRNGISVDNYALRSNSGLALFGTEARVNYEIGQILNYDMVVLQYGLNAMDPNSVNYTSYGQQFRKVVEYVKSCFPDALVVIMGVGDRGTQREGNFVTMRAIPAMIEEQRAVARDCGVVFWDTFSAMGGENSMAKFVQWNWAAKDYTHLSYRGGKYIATEFVKALDYAKYCQSITTEDDLSRINGTINYLPAVEDSTTYHDIFLDMEADDRDTREVAVQQPDSVPSIHAKEVSDDAESEERRYDTSSEFEALMMEELESEDVPAEQADFPDDDIKPASGQEQEELQQKTDDRSDEK